MDSQNQHDLSVFKVLQVILSFTPEVEFFHKFATLNKAVRLLIKNMKVISIWHTDRSKPKQDFLVNLIKHFDLKNMKNLSLQFCALGDHNFELVAKSPLFIQILQQLETLNLNGCRDVSDKTIVFLSAHCKSLKQIELYWNCRINDFCMKKLGQKCLNLEEINLSGCKYLSDSSI